MHKGPGTPGQLGGIIREYIRDTRTARTMVQLTLVGAVEGLQQVSSSHQWAPMKKKTSAATNRSGKIKRVVLDVKKSGLRVL